LLGEGADLAECFILSRSDQLPIVAGPASEPPRDEAPRRPRRGRKRTGPAGPFVAQLLGQDGKKRGLKAGPPALRCARAAYLEAEYSGEADRRLPVGIFARKRV
jgi:hypothetical protein